MAQTLDIAGAGTGGTAGNRAPFGLFENLERPGHVFRDLGPNWFASVMGTGIVANASAVLPLPGARAARVRDRHCHADVLRGASVFLFGLPAGWRLPPGCTRNRS